MHACTLTSDKANTTLDELLTIVLFAQTQSNTLRKSLRSFAPALPAPARKLSWYPLDVCFHRKSLTPCQSTQSNISRRETRCVRDLLTSIALCGQCSLGPGLRTARVTASSSLSTSTRGSLFNPTLLLRRLGKMWLSEVLGRATKLPPGVRHDNRCFPVFVLVSRSITCKRDDRPRFVAS